MAEWVSHLIVADRVLEQLPWLKRHEFCVGSIAPDCNIPNEDWSAFTPSREVTHWMDGERKDAADSQRFCQQYILERLPEIESEEELSFLFGYYAHLITDAEFQRATRDKNRVAAAWQRAKSIPEIRLKAAGMEENWDNFKKLFPNRKERYCGLQSIERDYLDTHPESGYFTEIQGLEYFPDYLDYLPHGAIPAKIKLMYYLPEYETGGFLFVGFSREEYKTFLDRAVQLSVGAIKEARERIIVIEEYLKNPCKASSLPLWKTELFHCPDNISVVREDLYETGTMEGIDEPYFKLRHEMKSISQAVLPEGFRLASCQIQAFSAHINACYETEGVSPDELLQYTQHPVYCPELWIAVEEVSNGELVASGIAELDRRIGEGVLEWIQVSPAYRRQGLGRFIVCELLNRLKGKADFATVSGRVNNPTDPMELYLACGFADPVIWHVITR